MSNTRLKENIKAKLEQYNMNPSDLERKAGLSSSSIRKILLGNSINPTLETLEAISKVFDCSIDDLAGINLKNVDYSNFLPKRLEWNRHLFEQVVEHVCNIIDENKKEVSFDTVIPIVSEIYNYCVVKKNGIFDESFSEWYITKKLD